MNRATASVPVCGSPTTTTHSPPCRSAIIIPATDIIYSVSIGDTWVPELPTIGG